MGWGSHRRMRTSGGGRLGAAARVEQFEKRVGAGEARGARAHRSLGPGRRELSRSRGGGSASGATSAGRGRCLRQPSLLALRLQRASLEPATARGCASSSGRLSSPWFCSLPPPCPGLRRPPILAVSRAGRAGGAVPASCPPLCRLLPLALLPLTVSLCLAATSGALGATERERGRGWMVVGAEGRSLAGLPLFTGPRLPCGGL